MNSDNAGNEALALFERSLDHPSDEREAWIRAQAGDNMALRNKALKYLSKDVSRGAAFHTGGAFHDTLDDTAIPDQIGAYKVTGLIGRGGMGSVYRGERASGDFDHDVAIKIVRPGAMSEKLIRRFEMERQTLARLSHPHIARLYDGGTLESGAPYIIMEYIEGLPITEWADRKALLLEARLGLLKAACEAVSHAHQNLIIHRDITPSNVLVDKAGCVKLIDFGIAKPFDEDAAITDMAYSLASMSFTPGFAAPERSKGAGANTLSDIYSLGKLLANLTDNQSTGADLKAIAAKATEIDPENRYGSVDALLDDLNNYLQGFPVDAAVNSGAYRFKKFILRHKFGSLLASAAFTALVAAFGITAYQYQQANIAKNEANKRFSEVRELANYMLFDLYDALEKIPGNTQILNDVADKSRTYLEALEQDKRASFDVKLETAIGLKRLSDVLGNPVGANLGDRENSIKLLKSAYEKLEILRASNPDNAAVTRALAEAAYSYATYQFISEDNVEENIKYAEKSAQLYDSLIQSENVINDDYLKKIRASLQAARSYIWMNKGDMGIAAMEPLKEEMLAYVATHPGNEEALQLSGLVQSELAYTIAWHFEDADILDGQYRTAKPYYQYAIDAYGKLLAANPDDYGLQRSLGITHYSLAQFYMYYESNEIVLSEMIKAENYISDLMQKDPQDGAISRTLDVIRGQMATVLADLGQNERAIQVGAQVLASKTVKSKAEPDNGGRYRDMVMGYYTYADVMKAVGNKTEACRLNQAALDGFHTIELRWKVTDMDRDGIMKEVEDKLAECS